MKTYVYIADDNELLLDDDESKISAWKIRQVLSLFGLQEKEISSYPSRSKNNQHFRVVFDKPLSAEQRIALQLACGSDWKREVLALRAIGKLPNTVIIFTNTKWLDKTPVSVCECGARNKGTSYCKHVKPYTHFFKDYEEEQEKVVDTKQL